MNSPTVFFLNCKQKIRREWRLAFLSAVLIGLLVHLPAMMMDVPNHDGLDSMYFDQNMITSGRWFLAVACGVSSFYNIPWVIGLFGLLFLGIAAAMLAELLEIEKPWAIVLVSGLLVSFPALASTFAYVFTLDGYMLALALAVAAVLLTKQRRFGFFGGALCLAFSMGIYQAYLPFAMILSIFAILMLCMDHGTVKEKVRDILHYPAMGILGAIFYYVILQILLKVEGKELASYQGIDGMASAASGTGLFSSILAMYQDFISFTVNGNVLWTNVVSAFALILLVAAGIFALLTFAKSKKMWKNPLAYLIMVLAVLALPLACNVILMISPNVTYHLLMRYQWVLLLIGIVAFVSKRTEGKTGNWAEWAALVASALLVFSYGIADNIGYNNLSKRYEKTYAYCVRLLDRIEQTEGYYQGIPIALVGVVGEEQFPTTDITLDVTSSMIGLNGDTLLYTAENYRLFMQYYLGATLNIQPADAMAEVYYSEAYIEMESFPGEDSIRIIDGVMYIKTENVNR